MNEETKEHILRKEKARLRHIANINKIKVLKRDFESVSIG